MRVDLVKKFCKKYSNYFDIIIDDGGHYKSHMLNNLNYFSNCLKKKFSLYVIEDYGLNFDYLNPENFNGLLNYNITKSSFLEIDYSKNKIGELNQREQIRAQISTPFKTKFISGLTRIAFQQLRYEKINFNQINFTFSGFYKQLKFK
jgi:hypothetical protein